MTAEGERPAISVRATTRFRNDVVLRRREALHLTQKEYADLLGIGIGHLTAIETMRDAAARQKLVAQANFHHSVVAVARDCGVEPDQIFPEWLRVVRVHDIVRVARVEQAALEYHAEVTRARFALPPPSALAEEHDQAEAVGRLLATLSSREREIIKLRYGIGDGYTYTLREVGRIFNISQERVRGIEAKALVKLQHPARSRWTLPLIGEQKP